MQQGEMFNDIKQLLDISSRVDEKVKTIQSTQQELSSRLRELTEDMSEMAARLMVLESKNGGRTHIIENQVRELENKVDVMNASGTSKFCKVHAEEDTFSKCKTLDFRLQKLEGINDGWQAKVKQYSGLVIQGVWVVIVCYILYRLGLNGPPIP